MCCFSLTFYPSFPCNSICASATPSCLGCCLGGLCLFLPPASSEKVQSMWCPRVILPRSQGWCRGEQKQGEWKNLGPGPVPDSQQTKLWVTCHWGAVNLLYEKAQSIQVGKITLYNNRHATIGVKPYAASQINEAPPECCVINHSQRIQSLPPPSPPKKENKLL